LDGYYHYAFSNVAREKTNGKRLMDFYEADIAPAGSAHDRACELFQQIVGYNKIKSIAEKLNLKVAELVYGVQHVHQEHRNGEEGYIYKPKYLKARDPIT